MFCRIALGIAGIATLALLPSCTEKNNTAKSDWPEKPGPKVLTTYAPLYCFAASVAGNDATVKVLLPTADPHDHGEVNQADLRICNDATLLFELGLDLDDMLVDRITSAVKNEKRKTVNLGQLMQEHDKAKPGEALLLKGDSHHDEDEKDADHDHHHEIDPHVWLCPRRAKFLVEAIRDQLKSQDPAHAAGYDSRAAEYCHKLDGLLEYGKKHIPAGIKVVSFHESLRYFADTFKIDVVDSIQFNPEGEPTQSKLDELVKLCVAKNVKLITVEPLTSTRAAEAIQKAVKQAGKDIQLLELDPIEKSPTSDIKPTFYMEKMQSNLENLAKAAK